MDLGVPAIPKKLLRTRRGRIATTATLSLLLTLSPLTRAVNSSSDELALVGGTVIIATGQPPIPDAVVLIENGRIKAVGPRATVTVPSGVQIVDAHGKFITPGIIDTNAHLVLMTVPEFFVKYEDRFEDIALESAQVGLEIRHHHDHGLLGPTRTSLESARPPKPW